MNIITADSYELTEKRIDACFEAASKCNNKDIKEMWYQKGMALVRKLSTYEQDRKIGAYERMDY